jgi:hypothetical protein
MIVFLRASSIYIEFLGKNGVIHNKDGGIQKNKKLGGEKRN